MKQKAKFFLNYCRAQAEGKRTDSILVGRAKVIFNQYLSNHEHVMFIVCTGYSDRLTFLLFCAAINGEL